MAQPRKSSVTDNGGSSYRLMARQDEGDFEYCVAIDFGTHGTGLGYADIKKKETFSEQAFWCKNNDLKNKTDILLTYDGQFVAFGYDALDKYKHQEDDDDDDDDSNDDSKSEQSTDTDDEESEDDQQTDNKMNTNHMLFESFKMALYEKKDGIDGNDGDIREKIACADGREYATATVFVTALKFMKMKIFELFKKKGINLNPDRMDDMKKIQWILTVPAIWSDRAKHKMEVWAISAGLISRNIHNHIRIVYEPDCASISCQYETADENKKKQKQNELNNKEEKSDKFAKDERYILIDAGGGTVDIACHRVVQEYCMEEIYHPSGGPWGSDYIDKYFEEFLEELFEKDTMTAYKEKFPHSFTSIKDNFRSSKCTFYNDSTAKSHAVKIKIDFIQFVAEFIAKKNNKYDDDMDCEEEFGNLITSSRPFGLRGHLEINNDELSISTEIWKKHLFDKVINPMVDHVRDLLENKVKKVKYLMLAGGLSSSKYFQDRIHESLGQSSSYKLAIKIPKRPILSVIDGALKLGLVPNYISGRRLQYTYGIAVDRSVKNVDFNKLPKGYADENSYIHPNTSKRCIKGLFSAFAHKNDLVHIQSEPIEKQYRRFHLNERKCNISIYCSNESNPYVVKGKPLASVPIKFKQNDEELKFVVRFFFGDTKIRAYAKGEELQLEYHYYTSKELQKKK